MLSRSQIKYIQSLGHKKSRDADNVFIAEGPKIVRELMNEGNAAIKDVYATKEWITSQKNIGNIRVTEVTEEELKQISQQMTPNQVLCVAEKLKWDILPLKGRITLALDNIQDPGNVGTIIRIADWFGVQQVILSDDCADIYNPKVVQASMGSIVRVRTFYQDLNAFLDKTDVRKFAAVLEGQPVNKLGAIKEGVFIIGNESKGIHESLMKRVNVHVTIPGKGRAESLNAAVATGIILSHVVV